MNGFLLGVLCVGIMATNPVMAADVSEVCSNYMESVGWEIESTLIDEWENLYGCDTVGVFDSEDVTAEMLENRNGFLIVERCFGMVTTEELDGGIFDCEPYNYISYAGAFEDGEVSKGDIVLTYLVYDPSTDGVDDIIDRIDFKIG